MIKFTKIDGHYDIITLSLWYLIFRNQKNMRETCRRVEINLHYELLYHSLGQNLVYNRAERVQLLRKAIIRMAELKAQVQSLSDQVRSAGMTPRQSPNFQLNDSRLVYKIDHFSDHLRVSFFASICLCGSEINIYVIFISVFFFGLLCLNVHKLQILSAKCPSHIIQ